MKGLLRRRILGLSATFVLIGVLSLVIALLILPQIQSPVPKGYRHNPPLLERQPLPTALFDQHNIVLNDLLISQQVKVNSQAPSVLQAHKTLFLWGKVWHSDPQTVERLRAGAAIRGLATKVMALQQMRLGKGDALPLFKLRFGPFTTVSDRNNARGLLLKMGVETALAEPSERLEIVQGFSATTAPAEG